jgi:hypothetical protein|tara:strand:- start:43 stop:183 length:141 start_codon:yes stop_codon:yes gene_type:complete
MRTVFETVHAGVVTRRAHDTKRISILTIHNRIHSAADGTSRPQRCA